MYGVQGEPEQDSLASIAQQYQQRQQGHDTGEKPDAQLPEAGPQPAIPPHGIERGKRFFTAQQRRDSQASEVREAEADIGCRPDPDGEDAGLRSSQRNKRRVMQTEPPGKWVKPGIPNWTGRKLAVAADKTTVPVDFPGIFDARKRQRELPLGIGWDVREHDAAPVPCESRVVAMALFFP